MSTKPERFKPDNNERHSFCDLDALGRAGPPPAPVKANNPHPNGCREFQLCNFVWLHRLS